MGLCASGELTIENATSLYPYLLNTKTQFHSMNNIYIYKNKHIAHLGYWEEKDCHNKNIIFKHNFIFVFEPYYRGIRIKNFIRTSYNLINGEKITDDYIKDWDLIWFSSHDNLRIYQILKKYGANELAEIYAAAHDMRNIPE